MIRPGNVDTAQIPEVSKALVKNLASDPMDRSRSDEFDAELDA